MNRKILLIIIIAFSILGITLLIMGKPRIKFNKLNISEEEWNSIIDSREEGDISLKSLEFNDCNLIIDEKNNKLYYSVINNNSNKYLPYVSFISSSFTARLAILNDEITEDKIRNNHEFKVILYDNDTYKIYGLYCTSFPMLNITYDEKEDMNDFNIPMSMYLFNNDNSGINRIVRSDGSLERIEMEDGTYNFKFSLTMISPGNNKRENVLSLLHMRPSNEYFLNVINVGVNDSPIMSNMNELVDKAVDFVDKKDMPRENVNNVKEKNEQEVELFINNEYIGLYSLGYNPNTRVRPKNR